MKKCKIRKKYVDLLMLLSIFFALVSLWWVFSNIQICVHTFLVEFLFSFFSSLVLETGAGVFYEVWVEWWVELYFPRLFNFSRSDLRTRVTFLFRGQRISQRSWAARAREDVYVEWEAEMRSTIKTAPATPRPLSPLSPGFLIWILRNYFRIKLLAENKLSLEWHRRPIFCPRVTCRLVSC